MGAYTDEHARKGLDAPLPPIECWANQFPNYRITIRIPEFTSVCPLTEQPDFGTVTITYVPRERCLELKSLKLYIHAYRQLGDFLRERHQPHPARCRCSLRSGRMYGHG
jgi:7-cyano-7-deazaguanine reductase